jgi:hypothetical protein
MSHFLIYAARLQDAGICSLWVSLGSDSERTRLMHVSPDATTPRELAAKFPTRSFRLDGTDPKLQAIEEDLIYGEGGVTSERVKAAIDANPGYAQELAALGMDWAAMPPLSDEEISDAEDSVTSESVERTQRYLKGLLRGMDIARSREASRAGEA